MALDTKKLKALCEAVIRDIPKEDTLPIAQDNDWARLTHESLPALEEFFAQKKSTW